MAYAIKVKKRAVKALRIIPQPYYKQIKDAILLLSVINIGLRKDVY